ncbi:MAG: DHA2 family efflux MFS transporter permease subunit [Candidatus Dormiibacterota bacterium]
MTEVLDRPDVSAAEVAAAGGDGGVATPRTGRFDYKWIALGVVLLGTIMTILDATIVNIAIPTLQVDLKAGSYADISWVVTGYMLAQGAVIPMAGWASDRFGTKRLYLVTIALFTLASMACGVAQNLPELVIFRVLQGLGGGMLMPIGMTIIMRAVGPQNMGRVMGIFGIPMLLAPAVGPVLGGWFVQDFSWRLIFYVNVPIGLIAFASAWRFLTESNRAHGLRLDTFGLLTAPPAAVAVMYAVNQSISLGWGSLLVVSLLVGAAVLLAAFVLSQLGRRRAATLLMMPLAAGALLVALRNGVVDGWTSLDTIVMLVGAALAAVNLAIGNRGNPEPLLQLRLFRDPTFSWSMGLSFIIVTALFGGMLLLPLYLQEVHGYSPLETGLLLLPQAITAAVAMPLGGYLTDRIGPRPVVVTGMVMLAGGGFLLAQIHPTSSNWLVVSALLLRGFAMGFSMMPSMAAAMARVPRQLSSSASSISNSLQRIGSSVGIAVLVTVLAAQFTTAIGQASCAPSPAVLSAASSAGHQRTAAEFCSSLKGQYATLVQNGGQPSTTTKVPPVVARFGRTYASEALSTSFDRTFAFITILTLLGVIPALFLRRPEKTTAEHVPQLDAA